MKLIGTATSPYVRKVRIVLNEKRIDYAFLLEDLNSPDSTLNQFNPLGKVPCLIMEDGKTLYDSSVIVDYLDTATPVGKLLPLGGRARAEVKCWEALANGVMEAAILVRLEETQRPQEQQSTRWIQHQLGKVHAGLKAMSQQLGNKSYCHDNTYSLADIAVGCALGWLSFRFENIDWRSEYENLANLFDRLSERSSFQETIPV
ncbi:MAG: glutathione S-transferase N-terminal domain-containing protein [Betaproteobacteria bacterium]|nr:glutathione S-transferase N-terminal domain-containing protein [Betaproteobacteria bacterium]